MTSRPRWFKMYKDYDAEKVMLSDTLQKKREIQLFNMEKEVRDLQRKRFAMKGDLFKLRQELVKWSRTRSFDDPKTGR